MKTKGFIRIQNYNLYLKGSGPHWSNCCKNTEKLC